LLKDTQAKMLFMNARRVLKIAQITSGQTAQETAAAFSVSKSSYSQFVNGSLAQVERFVAILRVLGFTLQASDGQTVLTIEPSQNQLPDENPANTDICKNVKNERKQEPAFANSELTTVKKIKILARLKGLTLLDVAARSNQTEQNLYASFRNDTLYMQRLEQIASALDCRLRVDFINENGERVITGSDFLPTSVLLRILAKRKGLSFAEIAKRGGQSPQNLCNKLSKNSFTEREVRKIAAVLGYTLNISFVDKSGNVII